jgi:hypothetical protein
MLAEMNAPGNLFGKVKAKSRLWKDVKVVAIPSRHVLEHNTYKDICKYLTSVKESGASLFIGSNDFGDKENPRHGQEKFQSGGYRPLNYNLPPFKFPKSILVVDGDAARNTRLPYALHLESC